MLGVAGIGTRGDPRRREARPGGDAVAEAAQHVVLALVLSGVLACQARALAMVLRARRAVAARRPPRITDLVWVAIPVAVVVFLAARSWVVALDLGAPAMAVVTPVEVSARQASPPVFHR
jgi:heme/copper-type cytochrome/quinol oxidase subunit 2